MILFPESLFEALVYAAIALATAGSTALIVLLAKDLTGRKLW